MTEVLTYMIKIIIKLELNIKTRKISLHNIKSFQAEAKYCILRIFRMTILYPKRIQTN